MSKFTYLFDPGHGGIINGQYVTPGKRSPKFEDGTQLYEGVNNRRITKECIDYLTSKGINCVNLVDSQEDISLGERVRKANKLYATNKNLVYISVHSDATGNGVDWIDGASGISGFTSPGQTKSDIFCSLFIDELENQLGTTVKWRKDTKDGDEDKEENFYVIRETLMPAILMEFGFHTNKAEAKRMMTKEWSDKIKEALYQTILKWEKI